MSSKSSIPKPPLLTRLKTSVAHHLHSVKCSVRQTFMSKPSKDKPKKPGPAPCSDKVNGSSSAEGFIPLAARDSQWAGLQFYNPMFRSPFDEQDDAEEMELQSLAADSSDAIMLLFPGLKDKSGDCLHGETSSTSEITKLLVGQKADFRGMKSSRKLISNEIKLSSVPEVPQEEKLQSENDLENSDVETRCISADDEEDEPDNVQRVKKRKKRSSSVIEPVISSVSTLLPEPSRRLSRSSRPKSNKSLISVHSSHADDESEINKQDGRS